MHQELFPSMITSNVTDAQHPRKAALLLHSLNQGDRQWLLQQLTSEQRAQMSALLVELNDLGIPVEPSFIAGTLHGHGNPERAQDKINPTALALEDAPLTLEQLGRADPAFVFDIMADEPISLVACLLAIKDWTWQDEFLARFCEEKQRAIRSCLDQTRIQRETNSTAAGQTLREQFLALIGQRLSLHSEVPRRVDPYTNRRKLSSYIGTRFAEFRRALMSRDNLRSASRQRQ